MGAPGTIDPDEALLEPGGDKRGCVVGRAIDRLTPEQREKVTAALAKPRRAVTGRNIAEYIHRKLDTPEDERFHPDSLAKHRRGSCGCQ